MTMTTTAGLIGLSVVIVHSLLLTSSARVSVLLVLSAPSMTQGVLHTPNGQRYSNLSVEIVRHGCLPMQWWMAQDTLPVKSTAKCLTMSVKRPWMTRYVEKTLLQGLAVMSQQSFASRDAHVFCLEMESPWVERPRHQPQQAQQLQQAQQAQRQPPQPPQPQQRW